MIKTVKDLFVGTWNVLSLYKAGALELLLQQLDKKKADCSTTRDILNWRGNLRKKGLKNYFTVVIKISTFWAYVLPLKSKLNTLL
jgi:hypothetical protein